MSNIETDLEQIKAMLRLIIRELNYVPPQNTKKKPKLVRVK